MRLFVDSLIALMLMAVFAGVLWHYRGHQRLEDDYQFVQTALDRLHDQALYHKLLGDVKLSQGGFPKKIQRQWFGVRLPTNVFVSPKHPWMDTAPEKDVSINPPDPVITDSKQAGFWYNPDNGIVRARVPAQLSDEATLEMYNRINGTELSSLPHEKGASNAASSKTPGAVKHSATDKSNRQIPDSSVQPHQKTSPHRSGRPSLLGKPSP